MILTELFNQTRKVDFVEDHGDFIHKTRVSDGTWLQIRFESMSDSRPEYTVVFYRSKRSNFSDATLDKTDYGNEIEVFSIVMNAINAFVQKYKPTLITFSASTENPTDPQQKRVRLYTSMARKFKPVDYRMEIQSYSNMVDFEFYRIKRDDTI